MRNLIVLFIFICFCCFLGFVPNALDYLFIRIDDTKWIIKFDKFLHFSTFFVFNCLLYYTIIGFGRECIFMNLIRKIIYKISLLNSVFITGTLLSFLSEYLQSIIPGKIFDVFDILVCILLLFNFTFVDSSFRLIWLVVFVFM